MDEKSISKKEERHLDEIEFLRQLFKSSFRNIKVVSAFFISSVVFSSIYAFSLEKIWEGRFQIVISDKNKNGADSLLGSLGGNLKNLVTKTSLKTNSQIDTEIEKLKSSSVLMPIFDFVKEEKAKKGKDLSKYRYSKWFKDSLTINRIRDTAVLELKYKDTDKDLIIPVVKKISEKYQEYSKKDKRINNLNMITYLDKQIKIAKKNSLDSLLKTQDFAEKYDLAIIAEQDILSTSSFSKADSVKGIPSIKTPTITVGVEIQRVKAANQIREIDEQIKTLLKNTDDPNGIFFRTSLDPKIAKTGLYEKINELDARLIELKTRYKEDDLLIKKTIEARNAFIEYLKESTISYLRSYKNEAKVRLKAAEREKGVIIKYKQYVRDSLRNQELVKNLENQKQLIELESAKNERPWELISNPVMLDWPVGPRKKIIVGLFGMAALFLGVLTSLIIDKKKNIIYELDTLKEYLSLNFLASINLDSRQSSTQLINLILSKLVGENSNKSIGIVNFGLFENELVKLENIIKEYSSDLKLVFSDNFYDTKGCSTQILVTKLGRITKDQIFEMNSILDIQDDPIGGWILLKGELSED